jgi:hypothetical protein
VASNDTVFTIEELVDRLHRSRASLSSAVGMLNNLRIYRDQLYTRQLDAQEMDQEMFDRLTDVNAVITQVELNLATLNTNGLLTSIEIRVGQRSNKTGVSLLVELDHFVIDANDGASGATISAMDADGNPVEAFADNTVQLFVANDKVELFEAANSNNNGIGTVASCDDLILTLNDPIAGGADEATDRKLKIRKIEDYTA